MIDVVGRVDGQSHTRVWRLRLIVVVVVVVAAARRHSQQTERIGFRRRRHCIEQGRFGDLVVRSEPESHVLEARLEVGSRQSVTSQANARDVWSCSGEVSAAVLV